VVVSGKAVASAIQTVLELQN